MKTCELTPLNATQKITFPTFLKLENKLAKQAQDKKENNFIFHNIVSRNNE